MGTSPAPGDGHPARVHLPTPQVPQRTSRRGLPDRDPRARLRTPDRRGHHRRPPVPAAGERGADVRQGAAPRRRLPAFNAALELWRGPVLGDLGGGPTIESFTTWAEEARLECTELLFEADLARGGHRELVAQLQAVTVEHPLREAFHQLLMLALYRSGRAGEALKVYDSVRARLDAELGIQPCRAMRELHRAVLLSDPALDLCAA
ncbi:AfsR/SARP family transcriptional regulator [Streptomyces sp. M19]